MPTTPLSKPVKHTLKEWLEINPWLTEQEAQHLVDNPPLKSTKPMVHEFPA